MRGKLKWWQWGGKYFNFFYQIPSDEQRDVTPCPTCFACFILENAVEKRDMVISCLLLHIKVIYRSDNEKNNQYSTHRMLYLNLNNRIRNNLASSRMRIHFTLKKLLWLKDGSINTRYQLQVMCKLQSQKSISRQNMSKTSPTNVVPSYNKKLDLQFGLLIIPGRTWRSFS